MNIFEKCDIINIVSFLCVFRIVNTKSNLELSQRNFSQLLFKEQFFFIIWSIVRQALSIFILIIQYFNFFWWFIISERSLHKRSILILSKSNFIFKSINRVEFNHIHAILNKFIKFLFQVFCIFYKVWRLIFFQSFTKIKYLIKKKISNFFLQRE